MSSNVNKYTLLNNKSTKKDITEAFFNAGFYIKPVYSVDPVTGDCSCGDDECDRQGKHPVLPDNTGFHDQNKYEKWLDINPNHCTLGIGVGYSKKLGKSLVVIDIDDMKDYDKMLEIIPVLKDTFQVKTRKGMHFYFWFSGHDKAGKPMWVNTKIRFNGLAVDVLAQGYSHVVAPGSVNKYVNQANEIIELSTEQVKLLNSISSAKKHYNNVKTPVNPIVLKFYAGMVEQGERNTALCAVSSKQLYSNKSLIERGLYTAQDHIEWLLTTTKQYCGNPLSNKTITATARAMFNRFDPYNFMKSKAAKAMDALVHGAKPHIATSSYKDLSTLKLIMEYRYQVRSFPAPYTNMVWDLMSIEDIMVDIQEQLKIAGAAPIHLKVQEVVAMLKSFHPELKDKRLDKIINGKRITKKIWNLTVASVSECSSDPLPYTNMVWDLEDTNKTEEINPEHNDKEVTVNEQIIGEEKSADSTQDNITTTSILEPSSASTVRPNVKDEQVPTSELKSPVEAPINFSDNLEEIFRDLLLLNQTIELNKKGH